MSGVPIPAADGSDEGVHAVRRSRTGRRPGDSGTRQAIHDAAQRQFADAGYDRTSFRSVAREAGVDPALVTHFFGTKAELFVQVAGTPLHRAEGLRILEGGDLSGLGGRLARFFLRQMADHDQSARLTAMIRAAASEPRAAAMVREVVARDVMTPIAQALHADRPELRGALAGSQMVGFVMARHVLQLPSLVAADDDELVDILGSTLQRYLVEPLP